LQIQINDIAIISNMNKQIRKIHVIGINSFEYKDLNINLQKLIDDIKNIAIPISYFDKIKTWFDNYSDTKNLFSSGSNNELINWLKQKNDDVILISRGDPLWFGIGRILLENFEKEELSFYPGNTCVQVAFSKLKKSWQDIKCISIHGRDCSELIKAIKSKESNLAILTDPNNKSLNFLIKNIIELEIDCFYELWICEELGLKDEKLRRINIREELPEDISVLNIIVLLKKGIDTPIKNLPLFGINDNFFKTFKDRPNLITKKEIRIQILADLELPEKGVLWDIGAGSGSIGLEAIRIRPNLELYCIDKRIGTKKLILENANRLGVMPKKISEIDINELINNGFNKSFDSPNRVIIGGCDKNTKFNVINFVNKFLKDGEIIVLPLINYDLLKEIKELLEKLNFETKLNLFQTYKCLSLIEGSRFEPNNPIFLIKAKKL